MDAIKVTRWTPEDLMKQAMEESGRPAGLAESLAAAALGAANAGDFDVEEELRQFEAEQRRELGLDQAPAEQWWDANPNTFTRAQVHHTTLWVAGLTVAHDLFLGGALTGLGYKIQVLDCPDNDALRVGKEFGNRGQCNPTYFTVGNLVKQLQHMRDVQGIPTREIIDNNLFLTAGACGPCRFGTYVTEYRKALRDAGFEGFRVILFQQKGGIGQAAEEAGLQMGVPFFKQMLKGVIAGDILNLLGYRIRPYELDAGATDRALEEGKRLIHAALCEQSSVLWAAYKARRLLDAVRVDYTRPKPKVTIIGEFWAMTTEGDGNYHLQRFLEQEGAEVNVQIVTAWLLYTVWEGRHDIRNRMLLQEHDDARYGLADSDNPTRSLQMLHAADLALRVVFNAFAQVMGLRDYHLPDMDQIAEAAADHYDNELRGGEGHMEVGKHILYLKKKKATMIISVKPFGCMPSSSVSDGVQSIITEKYPDSIYCPIETSGDGAVNVHSRVQMMLFKARQRAQQEHEEALKSVGLTQDELRQRASGRGYDRLTRYPLHRMAGTSANLAFELGSSEVSNLGARLAAGAERLRRAPARVWEAARDAATAWLPRAAG